mmetsp:Transcript_2380/g.3526  ORF Transcript_2380/g.3526 Transcript_2380/m.3526 type:complete len:162 (+) Transcript_2380:558-1043(+)
MIIDKVVPAIKEKWPVGSRKGEIIIQQDNAKPHCSIDDELIVSECRKDGWNITFRYQPPNSPDLNVLDLGYFNSIQALQHQNAPKTIDDLIRCVEKSFNDLDSNSLSDVFLSLQLVMEQILKSSGGNKYNLLHMSKKNYDMKANCRKEIDATKRLSMWQKP